MLIVFPFLTIWVFEEPDHYRELSDEKLVNYYQREGDQLIVAILIQRYSQQLAIVQYKFTKDRSSFPDFAHDLFSKMAEELKTVNIRTTFRQWLMWWSKNRLIDQSRRSNVKDRIYNEWADKKNDKDTPQYDKQMDHEALIGEAMALLNDNERICIQQYYLEEKSYKEIAEETGWKFKKVCNHIARGKEKLRNKLGDQIWAYFQQN